MADPGKIAIFESDLEAIFASYLIRIRLKNPHYGYYFYHLMKSPYYQNFIEGATTGSVQKNLNAKSLTSNLPVIIPNKEVTILFDSIIENLRAKINCNLAESTTLAKVRDSLLPKLMSGKIRVPIDNKVESSVMSSVITESQVEESCLDLFRNLGYSVISGPDISEGGIAEERKYDEVVLVGRLKDALRRINKSIPEAAIDEAVKKVLRTESQEPVANNQLFHKLVTDGVDVQYKREDGSIKDSKVWLFDFKDLGNNEFLAVNQFTIIEERNNRRPDIILFVNGLPLVLIELKNPADEEATISSAFKQFGTYQKEIPSIFRYNEVLVISDGTYAKAGTMTAKEERFSPWKTINAQKTPKTQPQIEVLTKGMLNKSTLMDLIGHFVVFEAEKDKKEGTVKLSKKIAQYQQYNAVQKALTSTVNATNKDRKAGIVWHTQGSGKSLTMVFYTGKLVLDPALENPTVIVLNDRNDLDDQLYGTFSHCHELLRQKPRQATSREELKELLQVSSGGIIFTTIQKFFPEGEETKYPLLSERKNIIIVADEAHRSQYGFGLKVPKNVDSEGSKVWIRKIPSGCLAKCNFYRFYGNTD